MAEAVETPLVGDSPTEPTEAKGLRGQLETALSEIKELKSGQKDQAFTDAGLDKTKGLGKAIFKEYEGELTKDAVLGYAQSEYAYEVPADSEHPQAQEIVSGQERLEAVGQSAGSIAPPTEAGDLAEAEATGDYQKTLSMKSDEISSWFSGKP